MAEGEPRRKGDPLAVAVFSVAVLLLAGLVVYAVFFFKPAPAPRQAGLLDAIRQFFEKPFVKAPSPVKAPGSVAQISGPLLLSPGRSWRYAVKVEPAAWRDITLTYRTLQQPGAPGVQAEFRHAGGQSSFNLGTFQAGHASHANTRFPGFFMYAAYLTLPLEPGQKLAWSWPWQQPGGAATSPGRVKRFQGQVTRWEDITVPAGRFRAARIEGKLEYVEDGRVRASASETLWVAPEVLQLVRIVREGRVPDESATRIVAELAEYR